MEKRILVIDDDVNIRTALKLRLERDTFVVNLAADGDDALRQVGEDAPDLIILDLTLPTVDGLDVLRQLKSEPKTAGIPVIILTARFDRPEDDPMLLLPTVEMMPKPFSPRHLTERVHAMLGMPA